MKTAKTHRNASWILYLFILFNIISYLYVIFTGTYNGDFLGVKSKLSHLYLFYNLLLSIAPFIVLYAIYAYYKRVNSEYKITIPTKSFGSFLFVVLIFQIIVTELYGVGKLGYEIYDAPTGVKIFIQIFNRFDVILGVAIYSIVVDRKNKFQYLLWLLVITLSILRTSLSIFVIIGLLIILLHYDSIFNFIKKKFLLIIILLVISPIVVGVLYSVRQQLRDDSKKVEIKVNDNNKETFSKMIFGRLVGRLSSFSNSAFILEREGKIKELVYYFSPLQYPKEAFATVYGKILNQKDIRYKNLIYESLGNHMRTYSSMNGTQGLLLISSFQSKSIFFINLFTILLIIILSFELTSLLHHEKIYDVVFLFFCFMIMSGDAAEYMAKLMVIILYILLFLFFNLIEVPKSKK